MMIEKLFLPVCRAPYDDVQWVVPLSLAIVMTECERWWPWPAEAVLLFALLFGTAFTTWMSFGSLLNGTSAVIIFLLVVWGRFVK